MAAKPPHRTPSGEPPLADAPPASDRVTSYDEQHFATYLRLLDAQADEAEPEEVMRIVLGLDPACEPERARRIYESHLARALWMTRQGWRDLLTGTAPRQ
jgi:hypothetical protein